MTDTAWYRADSSALEAAIREAKEIQPFMRLDDKGDRVVFRGRFEIIENEEVLEAFAIDVQLPTDSPRGLPVVWETGGRIPRAADPHHVNAGDGSLCVLLPEAYWYYFPDGLSLAQFLIGPLREHLAGQAAVLQGRPWPAGEWSHGAAGVMEFYHEVLQTQDQAVLIRLLEAACNPRMKGHWVCPCGSGKKLRHCHGQVLRALRKSPTFEPVCDALKRTGSDTRRRKRG